MLRLTKIGIFLILFTPVLYWNSLLFPAVTAKTFWFIAVSELTFFSFIWLIFFNPLWKPTFRWQSVVFFVYIGVLALTAIIGVYPLNSFWGGLERNENLLVWLHLLLFFVVLISIFRTERSWLQLCFVATTVGIVVSFFYLGSFILPGTLFSSLNRNGGAMLGNSSFLGTFLIFQLFFSVFLILRGTKLTQWFGVVSSIVFVFTLFMTDARAAMIAFVGGTILYCALILSLNQKKKYLRTAGYILLFILLSVFLFFVFSVFREGNFLHEIIVNKASGSRFVVWNIALQALREHPLFGWGLENFKFAFLKYYNPCFGNFYCGGNILFDRAHNKILDTLVESGILGLLAYLAVLCTIIFNVTYSFFKKNINAKICALVIAVLAAFFIQNLTAFDSLSSLILFVVLYGFSFSSTFDDYQESHLQKPEISNKSSGSYFIGLLFISFFIPFTLFFFILQPLKGLLAVETAVTTLEKKTRFIAYQKALFVSPFGRDIRRSFLGLQTSRVLWSYDPIKDINNLKQNTLYLEKESSLVKSALQDSIRKSPNDFISYIYIARILQAEGRLFDASKFSDAEQILREAIDRNPKHPLFYSILISVYLEQNKFSEASESMKTANALSPDSMRSEWNTLMFAKYVGNNELLDQSLSKLIHDYPTAKVQAETILKWDVKEMKYKLLSDFYLE